MPNLLDKVTWSVENAGETVEFSPSDPTDYLRAAGATGFGLAPAAVVVAASVAGGGTFRRSYRKPREVVVPTVTYGRDRADVEAKLRRLTRVLGDRYSTPRLVATYPDGSQFDTACYYSGGGDHQWGTFDTDGHTYCRWHLQLTCPSPYFTSRDVTQFTVRAVSGRGLLRHPSSLSALRLSSTQALGTVTVENPGDVETFPTWRLQGPGGLFTAARGDGPAFTLTGGVTDGDPVVVDTLAKTVRTVSGVNRYGDLAGAPKLFPLRPGRSTVQVTFADVTSASLVTLSFPERRELVF